MRIDLEYQIDELSKERYVFWFSSDRRTIFLDEYTILKKETPRHKYKPVDGYTRLSNRSTLNSINMEDVPLNEKVKEDALNSFISQIKVEYWNKR